MPVAAAPAPVFVPTGTLAGDPVGLTGDLARARAALHEAWGTREPDERFLAGHLVALRVAAVVLASGARPGRVRRPRNAWRAVTEAVPALAGWASVFAATESQRDAVRAGATGVVSAVEADHLVRATESFLDVVDQVLSAGPQPAATSGREVRR